MNKRSRHSEMFSARTHVGLHFVRFHLIQRCQCPLPLLSLNGSSSWSRTEATKQQNKWNQEDFKRFFETGSSLRFFTFCVLRLDLTHCQGFLHRPLSFKVFLLCCDRFRYKAGQSCQSRTTKTLLQLRSAGLQYAFNPFLRC